MAPTNCGTLWGHAMHIHPGGYCAGVWVNGTNTVPMTDDGVR